tara:strand:- start:60 stop:4283 length:4224 start_codon:yes stop_codon:yes gene_type:complete
MTEETTYLNARQQANNPLHEGQRQEKAEIDAVLEAENKGVWSDITGGLKEAPWQGVGGIADFGNEMWDFMGLKSASEYINERLPNGIRELSDEMRGGPLTNPKTGEVSDVFPTTTPAKTTTGGLIRGGIHFMTGFIPVLGQVNKLKFLQKGSKLAQSIKKGAIAGAPVDFAGFDPTDPNVANMVGKYLDKNPEIQRLVMDYLATNADDPAIYNRFKNAFVGAALGIVAEPIVVGGKALGKFGFEKLADLIRQFKLDRATARGKADLGISAEDMQKISSSDEATRLNMESDLPDPPKTTKTPSMEEQDLLNVEAANTALSRSKISTPTQTLGETVGEQGLKGNTLHFGSGQDGLQKTKAGKIIPANPDKEFLERITEGRVTHYDPGFVSTKDRRQIGLMNHQNVVSNFVLNVIAGTENRAAAMLDMSTSMTDDGVGYISVRGATDVPPNKLTGDPTLDKLTKAKLNNKGWEPFEDGWKVTNKGKQNFQRGFTPKELEELALNHFDKVDIIKTKDAKVTSIKVSKPKRFDERQSIPKPTSELPKIYTDRGIQSPHLRVKPENLDELEQALVEGDYRQVIGKTDINFDRINTSEDVKEVLNTFSELSGHEKTKVTFKETEELADFAGTSIKNVNELYSSTKGLDSKLLAARQMLVKSSEHMIDLAEKARMSGRPEDALAVRKHAFIHSGFQAEVSGIKTEIARALNAMKIQATGADAKLAQIDALVTSFGGRDNLDKFISSINHIAKQEDHVARLAQFVHKGATARTVDAILEAYITGLLWNPKTQIVNFLGNASASILGVLERRYAENINPKTGKLQLRRNQGEGVVMGEAHAMLVGLKEGYREAWQLARKAWDEGEPSIDSMTKTDVYKPFEKSISAQAFKATGNLGKFSDWVGNTLGLSTRALMSGDEFFKTINYRMHLHSLAHRRASGLKLEGKDYSDAVDEIIRNPESELHMESMDFARYNTFTEDLAKGSRTKQLQNIIESVDTQSKVDPIVKGALKAYIPFFRTPVNLLKFSAERTPGLRLLSKRLKDDLGSGIPERVQMAEAKMATGNAVFITTVGLAQAGLITGAAPKDKHLRANQRRVGWKPYSIVIPHQINPFSDEDIYVPYNRFDPIGMTIGISADYWQGMTMLINSISRGRDEGFHDLVMDDLSNASSMMVLSAVQNLEDRSYMQGLSNLMALLQLDSSKSSEQAAKDLINVVPPISFMSALRRGITRTVDPIKRVTDDDSVFKEIRNIIYSNIPGMSDELPADRDLEGNPQYYPGNGTNVLWNGFNNLVNPASPSSITSSAVDRRVQELQVNVTDIRGTRAIDIDGVRIELTSDQIDAFGQFWGALNKKLNMSKFDTGNDLKDRDSLKFALTQTKQAAKELLRNSFEELDEKAAILNLRQSNEPIEHSSPLFKTNP